MLQSIFGSIVIGGLLLFCLMALLIPIVVETGRVLTARGSRIVLSILGLGIACILFLALR